MYTLAALVALCAVTNALHPIHITGTTPPPIYCPNKLCYGKYDGNYAINSKPNYFVQCVSGLAYCQACWPLHLVFSERCNQCLYYKGAKCSTTEPWYPATTFHCPDVCPKKGPYFSGNINDPYNPKQYVACWKGATVGCIACPAHLEFNEKWNACLYQGKYKTAKYVDTHKGYKKPYKKHNPYNRKPYNPNPYNRKPYNPNPYNPNPYKPTPYKPYGGHHGKRY